MLGLHRTLLQPLTCHSLPSHRGPPTTPGAIPKWLPALGVPTSYRHRKLHTPETELAAFPCQPASVSDATIPSAEPTGTPEVGSRAHALSTPANPANLT